MRLKYIDAAKGFAMLLIVWGHTVTFYDPLAQWASAFKISLFYIATGLLLSLRTESGKAKKTPVKKLLLSTGIPYVFYSLLSLCAATVMMFVQNRDISFLTEKLMLTVTLNGVSTLWFLPSIFFGRLIFERLSCRRISVPFKVVVAFLLPILLVITASLVLSSGFSEAVQSLIVVAIKVFVAFWFIGVGFEAGQIMSHKNADKFKGVCISVILLISGSVVAFINRGVDLNNGIFGTRPLVFFLSGVLCSLGIIGIFSFICEKLPCRITGFAGKNSLFIMVTHLPLYIVPVVFTVVSGVVKAEGTAFDYVRAIITFVTVLIIEWLLILIKNKLTAKAKNKRIGEFLRYI